MLKKSQTTSTAPIYEPFVASPRVLLFREISVWAQGLQILKDISLDIPEHCCFGLLGPSGAGKSTLLQCVNRLLDLQPGFRVSGSIHYKGADIMSKHIDADHLRTRIGTVFQQSSVFPTSIYENVLFGLKRVRGIPRAERADVVEKYLRQAHLWDELKDRLKRPATELSVGQQQRLCIARTIAMEPEILLMDEPTSALDARSTEAIERFILSVRNQCTVILVTHDLEQARRVTDRIACLCAGEEGGEILETGCCDAVFANGACRQVFQRIDEE